MGRVDRPRKTLSLADRIYVIKTFEEKKSMRALADHFMCSLTQIKNIIRRKKEYLEQWENQGDLLEIRRRQSACFNSVGAVICEWAQRCQSRNLQITDDLLCLRGRQAARLLNAAEVRTTKYWVDRIKQKFKIFVPAQNAIYKSVEISKIIPDLLPSYTPNTTKPQIIDPMVIRRYITDEKEAENSSTSANVNGASSLYQSSESCQSEGSNNSTLYNNAEQLECAYYLNANYIVKEEDTVMETVMLTEQTDKTKITIKSEVAENLTDMTTRELKSYKEALCCIRSIEQFVLLQGNIRAVGLLDQLENIFKQELNKPEN